MPEAVAQQTAAGADGGIPHVLAIGASAGGIEPTMALVGGLRKTGRFCVVLAQHLSPKQPSVLAEIIARRTVLRVKPIEHWEPLEADTLYVTPPGIDVRIEDGRLLLVPGARRITPQPSVDGLFESLASSTLATRTIAVVLSGLGSDGSQGVRQLKLAGGLCLAQQPAEAPSPDMPEAALATGCVDYWGSTEQLGAAVMRLMARFDAPARSLTADERAAVEQASAAGGAEFFLARFSDAALAEAVDLRAAVNDLDDRLALAAVLASDPVEVAALTRRLLHPLGSFDHSCARRESLLAAISAQYRAWAGPGPFRAWCLGCAAGEEAYDMAFALSEIRSAESVRQDFVIYATDVLSDQVSLARLGSYTPFELQGLPEAWASQYFSRRLRHQQVILDVRKKIFFSVHDALEEAAWPQLHFVSCLGVLPSLEAGHASALMQRLHAAVGGQGRVFSEQALYP